MNKKPKLSREVQDVDEYTWYFESEDVGIMLVHWDGNRCTNVTIPWEMLISSVNRYKAVKRYDKERKSRKDKN